MSDEIKEISVKEFRALGFIQEINRRLLHPCGLAMSVEINDDDGSEKLGIIWDYRDDPEGLLYGGSVISQDKIDTVDKLWISKKDERIKQVGSIIQNKENA